MKTTLQYLKAQHAQGRLSKSEFIDQALSVHSALYEYVDINETPETNYAFLHRDAHTGLIHSLEQYR